jgi:hypothetical protein
LLNNAKSTQTISGIAETAKETREQGKEKKTGRKKS